MGRHDFGFDFGPREAEESLGTQVLSSGIFLKIHHSACGIKTGPTEMARGWEPPLKTWAKIEASRLERTRTPCSPAKLTVSKC